MIWALWLREKEKDNNAEGKLRKRDYWKNTVHSFLQCSFCILFFCVTYQLFVSSPLSSFLSPSIPLSLFLSKTCSPSLAWNFSFTSLPPYSFFLSSTLPWWYLIAVKQEAGEQTAGEPTLILNCAICYSHMTVLHARSNAMMPHHTWHINQSWPKSRREREREGERGRVWLKRHQVNS